MNSHFTSSVGLRGAQHLRQAVSERVIINRFFKELRSAEFFAQYFRGCAHFPTYDDYWNQLRESHGFECSTKLVAGKIGHSQIEQDGVGFVLQGHGKGLFRISGIDDFVAVCEIYSQETPHGLFIVNDQQFIHITIASYLREVTPDPATTGGSVPARLPVFFVSLSASKSSRILRMSTSSLKGL